MNFWLRQYLIRHKLLLNKYNFTGVQAFVKI